MHEPDERIFLCGHRGGHPFGKLKATFDRVMAEREGKRKLGIFRLPQNKGYKVKPLTPEQQDRFEHLFEDYKARAVERNGGAELTYQQWFSALCNARRHAKRTPGDSSFFYRIQYPWHLCKIYEKLIAMEARARSATTRPVKKRMLQCG
jgi:hypothetical protein